MGYRFRKQVKNVGILLRRQCRKRQAWREGSPSFLDGLQENLIAECQKIKSSEVHELQASNCCRGQNDTDATTTKANMRLLTDQDALTHKTANQTKQTI